MHLGVEVTELSTNKQHHLSLPGRWCMPLRRHTLHVCVFITAGPITKLCAWGEEDSGGHVL